MEREAEVVLVGNHEFRFVPPNQIRFYIRGVFDGPEVEAHFQWGYKYADLLGSYVDCIVDMTKFERVTDSGRQRLTRVQRPYPYHGCALLGATFATKAIANMVISAGKLLAPKSFAYPIKFVDTWEEAESWLAELKEKRTSARN